MDIQGKIGLITGGSSGIGLATARATLQRGAEAVIVTGQNQERLARAEAELKELGPAASYLWRAGQPEDTQALSDSLHDRFGRLDFVMANAGVCWPTPVGEIDWQEAASQMTINFTAPLMLVQALVPLMPSGGSIVLTTSCLHQLGVPGYAVYAASKAALRSLARTLSSELRPQGIRVNSLAPGPFETPIHTKFGMPEEQLNEAKSQVASMVPLGRFGQTGEIVDAALFLAGNASSYMLGEEISVDGGWTNL